MSRRFVQGSLLVANLLALRGVYRDLSSDGSDDGSGSSLDPGGEGGYGEVPTTAAGRQRAMLKRIKQNYESELKEPPKQQQQKQKRLKGLQQQQSNRLKLKGPQQQSQSATVSKDRFPPPATTTAQLSRQTNPAQHDKRDPAYLHSPTEAWKRKEQDMDLTTPLTNFTHYFLHIPKTGGVFARMLINEDAKSVANPTSMCDEGVLPVESWKMWAEHRIIQKSPVRQVAVHCGMHMTESHISSVPDHVYTVIRDPREHVLSQYFHCTEARFHVGRGKAEFMPNEMDVWLETWVDIMEVGRLLDEGRGDGGFVVDVYNVTNHEQLQWIGKQFHCYNPIDMQSTLLGFASSKEISKADLAEKIDVFGITSQLERSVCLVSIRWSGRVPERCVCNRNAVTATKTGEGESTKQAKGVMKMPSRALATGEHTHSVVHHGATYNATERQLEAIDKLTRKDRTLYDLAVELFEEEVKKVEEEYSIRLC